MSDYGRAALMGGLVVIIGALASGTSSVFGFAGVGAALLVVAGVDTAWRRRSRRDG